MTKYPEGLYIRALINNCSLLSNSRASLFFSESEIANEDSTREQAMLNIVTKQSV
jgi:hypothetical protein